MPDKEKQRQQLDPRSFQRREELKNQHQEILAQEAKTTDPEKRAALKKKRLTLEKEQNALKEKVQKAYEAQVKDKPQPAPWLKNALSAFIVGGLICIIGQGLNIWYAGFGLDEKMAGAAVTCTLIVAAGLLTGIGIFDEIGRVAGAGTIVPVTGFANSIVAAALEFKHEGMIYGVGYRLFTVAGPVIVYGTLISAVIGVIFYFMG